MLCYNHSSTALLVSYLLSGKKLFSGKHWSLVSPLPLPTENEQWKKIILRKAWVTSVALTFMEKKLFSRKHGSRVWPLP
jgi:hypothetical protein